MYLLLLKNNLFSQNHLFCSKIKMEGRREGTKGVGRKEETDVSLLTQLSSIYFHLIFFFLILIS